MKQKLNVIILFALLLSTTLTGQPRSGPFPEWESTN